MDNQTFQNSEIAKDEYLVSDLAFDRLFPAHLSKHSHRHWTPIKVARRATRFLAVGSNPKIIDVGAGLGKFCITGAHKAPKAQFTGIEQRDALVKHGNKVIRQLGLPNARLVKGDFRDMDFSEYTGVYFYNSFYENLDDDQCQIDDSVERSAILYHLYSDHLFQCLKAMRKGTRLVTYWSMADEVPADYELFETDFDGNLRCWIKNF